MSYSANIVHKFIARPNDYPFRRLFWKLWYNGFASDYNNININFINYGYADLQATIKEFDSSNYKQKEIYCAQLYHHVASAIPLEGLDVLEVGCGRGGGSAYILKNLHPKTMTGVDFSEKNIVLCQKNHALSQLNFSVGDAESLQFGDCSFDAVVNVESSHCYASTEKFFAEAYRVIRPNGYFLFADFRPKDAIAKTTKLLQSTGFKVIKSETITANVLKSMNLEEERKLAIIQQNIPKYLHTIAGWFSGCQGTPVYEAFQNGDLEYLCYVLQK